MRQILGLFRIGDIDDRGAVVLILSRERVGHFVAVMSDVGDPAVALFVNDGLVRGARLQVAVAHQAHVFCLILAGVLRAGVSGTQQ